MDINEAKLAIKRFVELVRATPHFSPKQAERDANLWIAGIRNDNLNDFTAAHMPRCREFACKFVRELGYL